MKRLLSYLLAALSLLGCAAYVGCDTQPTAPNEQEQALPLTLDLTHLTLIGNEIATLTASEGFANYSWSVDKPDCAVLTPSGNTCQLTANADGTATVTVRAGGKSASCALTLQTTNLVRLTRLKNYYENNLQLGNNDCRLSTNDDGIETSFNFAENVPTFTLHSGESGAGAVKSIQFTPATIETEAESAPIVQQLLERATITVTYYYQKSNGELVTNTFETYRLTYAIMNDTVTVTEGLMRNGTHFQSLSIIEQNAIQRATLRLLSAGLTNLTSGAKTACNVNLCIN